MRTLNGNITLLSLRQRFRQNQDDVSFTVMTQLAILRKHIMNGMDVESLTRELQTKSRSNLGRTRSPDSAPSESSLSSSINVTHEQRSQEFTIEIASSLGTGSIIDMSSGLDGSVLSAPSVSTQEQSWVDDLNSQIAGPSSGVHLSMPSPTNRARNMMLESPKSTSGAYLSDSVVSDSIPSTSASESEHPHAVRTKLFYYQLMFNTLSTPLA